MLKLIYMCLCIFILSNCSLQHSLNKFNESSPVILYEDTYLDVLDKFGEPTFSYFNHREKVMSVTVKFEDAYDVDVIYVTFIHLNHKDKIFNFSLLTDRISNSENYSIYKDEDLNYGELPVQAMKSEISYYKEFERSFKNNPELWIAADFDIRKKYNEDPSRLPGTKVDGLVYLIITVGIYFIL